MNFKSTFQTTFYILIFTYVSPTNRTLLGSVMLYLLNKTSFTGSHGFPVYVIDFLDHRSSPSKRKRIPKKFFNPILLFKYVIDMI